MNLSNIKNISIAVLASVLLGGGGYFSFDRYEKYQAVQVLKARTLQQMIFVKGGDFMMGDVGYIDENGDKHYFAGDADVFPVHQVTLTSYSMSSLETTFGDYDVFTNYVGKDMIAKGSRDRAHKQPDSPAWGMNWYDAREYCQWLGQEIGYAMDLPTEAQWEYAARSRGLAVAYATNNGEDERGINIRNPSEYKFAMPVGSWPPNPLGMHDMTGSVNEWTVDNAHSYTEEAKIDPIFDEYIAKRPKVTRGFGIIGASGGIKLYKRIMDSPENTGAGNGIRCVVNHPEQLPKQLKD
ncbi:formylglycine-generating enzyme family protein [Pseudomonas sp. HK3]